MALFINDSMVRTGVAEDSVEASAASDLAANTSTDKLKQILFDGTGKYAPDIKAAVKAELVKRKVTLSNISAGDDAAPPPDKKFNGFSQRDVENLWKKWAKNIDAYGNVNSKTAQSKNDYLHAKSQWQSGSGWSIKPQSFGPSKVFKASAISAAESLFPKTKAKPIIITVKSGGKSKMGPMSAAEVAAWIADEIVEDSTTFGKATAKGNVITVTGAKKSKVAEIANRESFGAKIEITASAGDVEAAGDMPEDRLPDRKRVTIQLTGNNLPRVIQLLKAQFENVKVNGNTASVETSFPNAVSIGLRRIDPGAKVMDIIKLSGVVSAAIGSNASVADVMREMKAKLGKKYLKTGAQQRLAVAQALVKKLSPDQQWLDGLKNQVQMQYQREKDANMLMAASTPNTNARYIFPNEQAASTFVDTILRMGKGLKAAYKGRAAVVLNPGVYAAEVSDAARKAGGKPPAAGASVSAAAPTQLKATIKTIKYQEPGGAWKQAYVVVNQIADTWPVFRAKFPADKYPIAKNTQTSPATPENLKGLSPVLTGPGVKLSQSASISAAQSTDEQKLKAYLDGAMAAAKEGNHTLAGTLAQKYADLARKQKTASISAATSVTAFIDMGGQFKTAQDLMRAAKSAGLTVKSRTLPDGVSVVLVGDKTKIQQVAGQFGIKDAFIGWS